MKYEKIEVPGRKIKVVENVTGIISMYFTLNLEEFFHFLTRYLEFFCIFISVDSLSNIEKIEDPGPKKIKVVENLTGIISMYLTLNLEEFFSLSHPTLTIFLIFHLCGQFIKN